MSESFRVMPPIVEMMTAFGQEIGEAPHLPDEATRTLRKDLLREEYEEYLDAECTNDLVEVADALADMVVIISGTAAAYGINLDDVLAEVHGSNMSKIDPETRRIIRRADGKVLKPESWVPPRVRETLDNQEPLA